MTHPTPDDLALIALGEDVDGGALDHVGECRACYAELEALQQVVAVGRSLGPDDRLVAPHPRVWQRITQDLHATASAPLGGTIGLLDPTERPAGEPAAAPNGTDELARRRSPVRRRWVPVALAAAAALVVGLGGGYFLRELATPAAEAGGTTQLNALPQWPGANGTATVEDGGDGQRTLVVTMDMPANIAVDGTFEVWVSDSRAQDMVPMGTMTGTSARFPVPASVDLVTHPIVDVSLEPPGDTDPAHSDVSVVRGRLKV